MFILHTTDFVNTSFTNFYEIKLSKNNPILVTNLCHHKNQIPPLYLQPFNSQVIPYGKGKFIDTFNHGKRRVIFHAPH